MLKKLLKITVASLLSFSAFAQIPTNGLVAHYPFDGNTNDASGNGHKLTAYGSVSYTTDNFSNSNAAVSIATGNYLFNSDTDIMPAGSYSVAYWVKVPTLTATYPTVLEMNEGIYCRYFKSTGNAQLGGYFTSTQNYNHDFGGMVNNQWNHFVITVDVSTGISNTYLNGVLSSTKSGINYNSTIIQNTGLIIGGGTNSGVINPIKYLAGQVDNVLIYNRALSSVEVGNIYADNNVVSAPSLSIYNPAYQINATSALIFWDINANNGLTTIKTQLANDVDFLTGFQEFTSTSGDVSGNSNVNQNFRFENLSPSTTYYARVVGTNSAGTGFSGVLSFTTSELPLPVIVNTNAEANSLTSIKVFATIEAKDDQVYPLIEVSNTQSFDSIINRVYATPVNQNSTGITSGVIVGLQSGQTYFYRVVTGTTIGSVISDVKSFTLPTSNPFTPVTIAEFDFDNSYFNQSNDMEFVANSKSSFSMDRNGNANSALNLVDTNIVVEIPNMPTSGWDRTISLWVKLNAYSVQGSHNYFQVVNRPEFDEIYGWDYDLNIYYYDNQAARSAFFLGHSNLIFQGLESPNTKNELGEWNHIVFVFNNGVGQLFKNDTLIASGNLGLSTTGKFLVLGGDPSTLFSASYDDLKIYNYALSPTEVHNLYTDNVLVTNIEANTENELGVYPNPATDNIYVAQFSEVFDLVGSKVAEGDQKVDLRGLSKGVYVVKSAKGTQRIIKE